MPRISQYKGIEKKPTAFVLKIGSIRLNYVGKFFLRLSVVCTDEANLNGVSVCRDGGETAPAAECFSSEILQEEAADDSVYTPETFDFNLPKGFCRDSFEHESYLVVQVAPVDNPETYLGEAKIAIFPPMHKRASKLDPNAQHDKYLYSFSTRADLLRPRELDKKQPHGGIFSFTASLVDKTWKEPELENEVPQITESIVASPRTLKNTADLNPQPTNEPTETITNDQNRDSIGQYEEPQTTGYVQPSTSTDPRQNNDQHTNRPVLHKPVIHRSSAGHSRGMSNKPTSFSPENAGVRPSGQLYSPEQMSRPVTQQIRTGSESPLFRFDLDDNQRPSQVKKVMSRPVAGPSVPRENVSTKGLRMVHVLLHGAFDVPFSSSETPPNPFVIFKGKTKEDSHRDVNSDVSNEVISETNPVWESEHATYFNGEIHHNDLTIKIADAQSREMLCYYQLPVSYLQPFLQYHVLLRTKTRNDKASWGGTALAASITLRSSKIDTSSLSTNYCGLQFFLGEFRERVNYPVGSLVAVVRIVPDFPQYRNNVLYMNRASVISTEIQFPHPSPLQFAVPSVSDFGFPQVSLPSTGNRHSGLTGYDTTKERASYKPMWNYPFLFAHNRDVATMFSPQSALVVEFYPVQKIYRGRAWDVTKPIAWTVLNLDGTVYDQLSQRKSTNGMRMILSLLGSDMRTFMEKPPTLTAAIKLIRHQRPGPFVLSSIAWEKLPLLDYDMTLEFASDLDRKAEQHRIRRSASVGDIRQRGLRRAFTPNDQNHSAPFPVWGRRDKSFFEVSPEVAADMELRRGGLPSEKAIQSVLPQFVGPPNRDNYHTRNNSGDHTANHETLAEDQLHELATYQTAAKKMGNDIVSLQGKVAELEHQNSLLRASLAHYDEAAKSLVDASRLDGLTNIELIEKYVAVRQKAIAQSAELSDYKDRVQKLQNELIKKNDSERRYLEMNQAHTSQQKLVQQLQDRATKVKRLEEACVEQEQIIQKLEKLLKEKLHRISAERPNNTFPSYNYQSPMHASDTKAVSMAVHDALIAENNRLRQQIVFIKEQESRNSNALSDSERVELYAQLEKAKSRIASLEGQLVELAKRWGQEKQELVTRVHEAKYGLGGGVDSLMSYDGILTAAQRRLIERHSTKLQSF